MDYEVFEKQLREPMLKDAADAVAGELLRLERIAGDSAKSFERAGESCIHKLSELKTKAHQANILLGGDFEDFLHRFISGNGDSADTILLLEENETNPVQTYSLYTGNRLRKFMYKHFGFKDYVIKILDFMQKYAEYVEAYKALLLHYAKMREQLVYMNNSAAMQIESFATIMEVQNGALISAGNAEEFYRMNRSRYRIPDFPSGLINLPQINKEKLSEEGLRNILLPYFIAHTESLNSSS